MLPEILGISVPAKLLALAPSTYSGFSAHAETVRQKKLERQTGDGNTKSFGRRQYRDESREMHVDASSHSADCSVTDETDSSCDTVHPCSSDN